MQWLSEGTQIHRIFIGDYRDYGDHGNEDETFSVNGFVSNQMADRLL